MSKICNMKKMYIYYKICSRSIYISSFQKKQKTVKLWMLAAKWMVRLGNLAVERCWAPPVFPARAGPCGLGASHYV